MSKTYSQPGHIIDVVLTAPVLSGDVGFFGSLLGIYVKSGAIGDVVGLEIDGVHQVTKLAGTANTLGQVLYWDNTAKKATVVVGSNTFMGYCADPAVSAAVVVKVLLARPGV